MPSYNNNYNYNYYEYEIQRLKELWDERIRARGRAAQWHDPEFIPAQPTKPQAPPKPPQPTVEKEESIWDGI